MHDPAWAFPFGAKNQTCGGCPFRTYVEFEPEAMWIVGAARETCGLEFDTVNR